MGHIARLRLICDRFIAGHDSCALRRHLASVAPETPIRDIVDRCRLWESHADTEAQRFSKPGPEGALPIYTVDEPGCGLDDRMVAAVTNDHPTGSARAVGDFAQTVAPHPGGAGVASQTSTHGIEKLVSALTGGSAGTKARSTSQDRITDMETLLQSLLPGTLVPASWTRPGPIRRDWATVVCFSCGKAGHGVGRCPELNETFPFMLPGWAAEKVGGSYVMISPRVAAENGD